MALNVFDQVNITNAGLTQTYDAFTLPDIVYLVLASNLTLAANVDLYSTVSMPAGTSVIYYINGTPNVDLNGFHFGIEGYYVDEEQLKGGCFIWFVSNGSDWSQTFISPSLDNTLPNTQVVDGKYLVDGTILMTALETLPRGSIIRGNSSDVAAPYNAKSSGYLLIGDGTDLVSVAQSGDVTFNTSGVSAIGAGVIVNADVNASAAIARTKLASGTASHVVINDGSGVMSSEAQLDVSRGGTGINTTASTGVPRVSAGTWSVSGAVNGIFTSGQLEADYGGTGIDSSASTGFATISSGTWSASTIAVDRDLDVSFESGEVGDFKIYMGFAGTLTNIYAYATKAIAGTDNGTIVPKNNAGTTMATGTVTFTASDARGTAYTATPSTNNTFIAGDILTFTCAKTTAGGKAHLSLKFTRTS